MGLLSGTGNTVLATTDQIIALGNTGFNVSGSGNAISLAGAGAYLGVLSGTGEDIAANNDQIVTLGGVGLSVGGNGNSISLVGSNSNLVVTGNNNAISLSPNSQTSLTGTGNTVNGMSVGTSVTAGITDTVVTNSDGSWTENIVNNGNPALNWSEEQFVHASNNQVEEMTINYTNGTHTIQYWDVNNAAVWSTVIKQYNSGGGLTTETVYNSDGSNLVSTFNYDGLTGYTMTDYTAPNGQTGWFETNPSGYFAGGTSLVTEELLNPLGKYYNEWSGGSVGSIAGDIEIDDVFNTAYLSATATFNSAQSLTDNLGVLPIPVVYIDIISH